MHMYISGPSVPELFHGTESFNNKQRNTRGGGALLRFALLPALFFNRVDSPGQQTYTYVCTHIYVYTYIYGTFKGALQLLINRDG